MRNIVVSHGISPSIISIWKLYPLSNIVFRLNMHSFECEGTFSFNNIYKDEQELIQVFFSLYYVYIDSISDINICYRYFYYIYLYIYLFIVIFISYFLYYCYYL